MATVERKALVDQYVQALDASERIRAKFQGKMTDMSAEDQATWERWLNDADEAKKMIDLIDREGKARAWASGSDSSLKLADGEKAAGATSEGTAAEQKGLEDKAVKSAWKSYFRGVSAAQMTPDSIKALASQEGDLGGFLVIPQVLVERLIALVKDRVFVRSLATVIPMAKAESLGVPVLDTDLGDPTWTSELATGAEDTTAPFSKRQLTPHPLARRIKISNKLLRQSTLDPEAIVMDRLAYRLARVQENAFLNGTGQDQPLGVFVASASGISTARDTVAASATVIAGDDLITLKHNLKPQYWAKAQWAFHRLVLSAVRKLKDTAGNYLWQPGIGGYVAQGTTMIGPNPDMILGLPYNVSELAPSTFTTGLYLAVLGDFSFYWICDALDMQIQRLIELYAETNQTGFIVRAELDGSPVLEEAFARLRLA